MTAHPAAVGPGRPAGPHRGRAGPGRAGADQRRHPEALDRADAVFLRTARHPAAAGLGGDRPSFDHHYDDAATFDEVYARIVEDLVAAAGHGRLGRRRPGRLRRARLAARGRAHGRAAAGRPPGRGRRSCPALSFLDLAWDGLGVDPVAAGVRLVDGTRFAVEAAGERGPLLVAQCWSRQVLSEIKLAVDPTLRRASCPPPRCCTTSACPTSGWSTCRGTTSTGPSSPTTSPRCGSPGWPRRWPASWWPWTSWCAPCGSSARGTASRPTPR